MQRFKPLNFLIRRFPFPPWTHEGKTRLQSARPAKTALGLTCARCFALRYVSLVSPSSFKSSQAQAQMPPRNKLDSVTI